jgi:GNAT superfamily N-acetyltransferase
MVKFTTQNEISNELKIELWNDIIHPQYFYEDIIYYEWYNEVIPYNKEYYDSLDEDKKQRYLINQFGKKNPEAVIYNTIIYDDNDKKIGWICWNTLMKNNKKTSYLKYVILESSLQKKGIGSECMKYYLNWCFNNEVKESSLTFNYWIIGLKEFYSKWNYKGNTAIGSHTTWFRKITKEIKRIPKTKKTK